jgi:hypothetical protein
MLSDPISNSENQYGDEEEVADDDIEGDLVEDEIVVNDEDEILESALEEEED